MDYKHHPGKPQSPFDAPGRVRISRIVHCGVKFYFSILLGDVIAGGLLGTVVQVFNALFVTKVFKFKTKRGSLAYWPSHSQKPFLRTPNQVEIGL